MDAEWKSKRGHAVISTCIRNNYKLAENKIEAITQCMQTNFGTNAGCGVCLPFDHDGDAERATARR